MSTEEKIYIGNAKIVKTQYGDMPKGSMHKDHINMIVKYMKDNNLDWINWDIKEKQTKVEGKPTHYIEVNTYKPDPNKVKSEPQTTENQESDDLPF